MDLSNAGWAGWPTRDYSIQTLATYLGFKWRDTHPSGATSIGWFDQWIKAGDPAVKQRILDYNEDDCRATRVLLDGITPSYMTRVLRLSLLAPDIVEAILDGRQGPEVTLARVLEPFPLRWDEQEFGARNV